jgi:hypothetical protein
MFRGGANGVNIKWIVRCEILCNNANGQLRTLMQRETHTVSGHCLYFGSAVSGQAFQWEAAWLRWSCVGSTTVSRSSSTKFCKVLCCPLFATPIIPFLHPWLSHYALLPQGHFGCKTRHVFVHLHRSAPLLWFKVRIVCSSAVEALPDHLRSSCIASLTELPVVWWTGGECLQGQGELSKAAGCMVSDRTTWSLHASADSIDHRLLIFCPDGWGVSCAPLTVHLYV